MIERFDPSTEETGIGAHAVMKRANTGEWVRYADHLALESRVSVLEGKVDMLQEDISELR